MIPGPARIPSLLVLCAMAFSAGSLSAQVPDAATPAPFLATLTPCGGKRGATVEVTFAGNDLDEARAMIFDHPGITATAVVPPAPAPMPGKPAPAPAPVTKFLVKIAPDAPPGLHDARVVGRWGVSQPRVFVVGDMAEVAEKEPNNDLPEAQRVELESTVTGVISSGTDVDYVVFKGVKGKTIHAACLASAIDSRLAPLMELYDAKGRILASSRPMPKTETSLLAELPADGDYFLRLASFTYQRGGPNHYYRLTISTLPWIESFVPPVVTAAGGSVTPMGPSGALASIQAQVPGDLLSLGVPRGFNSLTPFRLRETQIVPAITGAPVLPTPYLGVTSLAIAAEKEPNDAPEQAQEVSLGADIHGIIGKRSDADWFRVKLKKDQPVVVSLLGDAVGSMADLTLSLRLGAAGADLADLDDPPAGGPVPRLLVRGDDPPAHSFTPAADGEYFIRVGSRLSETAWGNRHFYRLQVAPPRPRFEAVALVGDLYRPTGLLVPKGGHGVVAVGVFREEGFSGEVTVTAEGLPAQVVAQPLVISAGSSSGRMSFRASADAPSDPLVVRLVARAKVGGAVMTRSVAPTGYVWPVNANNNNIVPPARAHQTLVMACVDQAPFSLAASLAKPALLQGEKGELKVVVTRSGGAQAKYPVNVQTLDLPANFVNNNQAVAVAADKNEAVLAITVPATMAPGPQVIQARGQAAVPFAKDPAAKQKPNTSTVVWSAPVVLQVLPKALATISLSAPQVPVKAGQSGELVVKVARLHEFDGPFTVELTVPPAAAAGLQVGPATCPAGASEIRVPVRVAPGSKPGPRNDCVIKLTGTWPGGQPISVDAKFAVVVNP